MTAEQELIANSPEELDHMLHALELADAWLDGEVSQPYKDQPLAQDWARTAKAAEETGEAITALIAFTGQNPRKGICGTREQVLAELADSAVTCLLGIQHFTKSPAATWAELTAALEKVRQRAAEAGYTS